MIKSKLCLLAAGIGSRINFFPNLHKSLLPIMNKPAVSKIIDKVDINTEIVVAIGHLGNQVKSYLTSIYPERKFKFINVDNYCGSGSGPGLSLLSCKKELQCPFVFTSIDTIVEDDVIIDDVAQNWIGVSNVDRIYTHNYCLVSNSDNKYVDEFKYNIHNSDLCAFIGMAGIYDFELFWEGLARKNIVRGEHQVIDGLEYLIANSKIKTVGFTWYDTGNKDSYNVTKTRYPNDLVVEKNDEIIYLDNNRIIKYFSNKDKCEKRHTRSQLMRDVFPMTNKINQNMFSYDYLSGKMLTDVYDENILKEFLEDYYLKFTQSKLPPYTNNEFKKNCTLMYEDKTKKRIKYFQNKEIDNIKFINGIAVGSISDIIDSVDWHVINRMATPSLFHGDLQPENIIVTRDGNFCYIDWRESFGESLAVGDAYYDLGKLYHALLISNQVVQEKGYNVIYDNNKKTANINYKIKSNLWQMQSILKNFCEKYNFSYKHVKIMGVINYLNIACLYNNYHEGKYGEFLFLLGKLLLTKELKSDYNN
jgi:choline kinase/fructosamine-3-kinase